MNRLRKYRQQIDELDEKLVSLLAKRCDLVAKIGKEKKKNKLPIIDKKREAEKRKTIQALARNYRLDGKFLKDVWNVLWKKAYELEG